MVRNKQRKLISLLMRYRNLYKTSIELAIDLSLSDRTIRTYLKDLKDIIESNGGVLISKQGLGYQLKIKDRTKFNLFLIENHFLDKNKEQSKCRGALERKHYLLNLLLLEDQRIDIEDLSDSLFISSSQLNKDITEIKSELQSYGLTIVKHKSLVFVEGNEKAKRHFIMRYFFYQKSVNFLQQLTHSDRFVEAISFDALMIIILDECREAHVKLSDVMIQNIVLHLALTIKRLQSGFSIQHIDMPDMIIETLEFQVAKKIIARVESVIGFHFPKEEQRYLTLHLITKSNVIQNSSDSDLNISLTHLLIKMQEKTGYLFLQDEQLKSGLLQHLKPMLIRLKQKIKLDNPLLDEIKTNYSKLFTLTKFYCCQLPDLRDFEISDDEWGYLVLHFLASIEKLKNEQKAKVLIICATGLGSAQLLKNRVESEFDDRIKIVGTKGYYEITSEMLKDIDLIISSIDLSTKIFKIPIFYVSIFFTEQDVQQIRRYLSKRQNPLCTRKECISVQSNLQKNNHFIHLEQIVDDFISGYFHIYQQRNLKKDDVIGSLLTLLSLNESNNYKNEMMVQIENRMALGDIFFSQAIVVPHPAIPVGKLSKVGVGIIPNGLFWNENYPSIRFVFMISPSMYQNSNLSIMTKAIVALIDDEDMQNQLLNSKTFIEFKQIFIKLIEKGA